MPRGDGTGPPRRGGSGTRRGRGKGMRKDTRVGSGTCDECVCPSCGTTVLHKEGIPCFLINCPSCGTSMERK